MKILLLIILPIFSFAQNSAIENKLIINMCTEFRNTENLSDSLRVENTYSKYLYPYLQNVESSKIDSIGNSLYFRFQRECETFRKFLDRVDPLENFEEIKEMPISTLSVSEKKEFKKTKNFYYLEGDNNITNVIIDKNLWIDIFPDNSFSKNKFYWKNENDFELEFIESTNINRKGFSRLGDKYFYKIIRKENNYYVIAGKIPNQNQILLFKLFVK